MPAPFRTLLLAAALLAPMAAAAQEAAPSDGQIVVTGQRTSEAEIATFVDSVMPAPPGSQLGRFHWAVCPRAAGVAPAQAALVADRIRKVARAAGLEVGGADCTPNLLVIVTPNKAAFLEALRKRRPEYFDGLTRAERAALLDPGSPVAAWHVKGPTLNADGHEIAVDPGAGVQVNRTTRNATRIGFLTYPQFAAAILVIEDRALTGLTTTQLADYAAMRTLISSKPERLGSSRAPTILRIIDAPMGSEVPLTLTEWDLGILKAFYASRPTVSAAAQRSDVQRQLGNELEGDRD